MENRSRFFWTLVPPRGDGRLVGLQSNLLLSGSLILPPPWPFLPLAEAPLRRNIQADLPLKTEGWDLQQGWVGLRVSWGNFCFPEGFPPGMILLGRAERMPETAPPALDFQTLRAQQWRWTYGSSPEELEVLVTKEIRIGRG